MSDPANPTSTQVVSASAAGTLLRKADDLWVAAMQGFEGYGDRMRTISRAAREQSRALMAADLANIQWKPRPGASKASLPVELDRDGGRRPGDPAWWEPFDRAVGQLGEAYEGRSIQAVIIAYAELATVASELASALDAPGESEASGTTGGRKRRAG